MEKQDIDSAIKQIEGVMGKKDSSEHQDVEYIKLSKNSRGYTWDIKVLGIDDIHLAQLKKINEKIEKEYGTLLKGPTFESE